MFTKEKFCYKVAEESRATLPKMKKVEQWSMEYIDTKYNGKKDSYKKYIVGWGKIIH